MGNNIIIGVNFSIAAEKLRLTLEDNSMPFDINAIPTSGINKPLKQLKPGGLGIHLIKNIADNLYYIPLNPGNKVVVEFNCTSST
jgi:anti-sigma regulatory factor (Ser/Thr protein kinase)